MRKHLQSFSINPALNSPPNRESRAMPQPIPARPAFARWLGDTNDVTKIFLSAGQIPGLINMAGGLPIRSMAVPALSDLAAKAITDHPPDASPMP